MKLIYYLYFWIAIFFASCSTSKPLTSDLNPAEIKNLQIFHPVSRIHLINKGNISQENDSISRYSKILLLDIIRESMDYLPLGQEISAEDPLSDKTLEEEIEWLFNEVTQKKQLDHVNFPPMVSHVLKENNQRFGLLTYTTGFTRRKGNHGGQMLKGLGIGILTFGMYYPVPIKASSYLGVMIVDNQTQEVVFFKNSLLAEQDPLNKKGLIKQMNYVFKGYFDPLYKTPPRASK